MSAKKDSNIPSPVIPEGTPAGAKFVYTAVGLTLVVVLGAFAYLYAVVRPELTQYLQMKEKELVIQSELVGGETTRRYDALSALIATHTNQLGNISGQLGEVRAEKKDLEYKVSELEKRVFQLEDDLSDCELKLFKCNGNK